MQEWFVDVTWRGLEVGHRVKLHGVRSQTGYLDHGTPMPVGTELAIRTDEGVEVPVTVLRIHEQVGGSTETPGMEIAARLEGAGAAWWAERAEPAAAPEPAAEPEPVDSRATARTLDATEAAAAATAAARTIEVTAEAQAAAFEATGEAPAVAPANGTPDVIDDGRKTEVMSAVDVAAIIAAGQGDDDGDGNGDGDGDNGDGGDGGDGGEGGEGGEAAPVAKGKKRRTSRRRKKAK